MVTESALDIIRRYEGLRLQLYDCPAHDCSIGYGHKLHNGPTNGSPVEAQYAHGITKLQAENLLYADADLFADGVRKLAPRANQNQLDALTSFAFNLGLRALENSTLLRKFNAGDVQGAASEFGKWVNVNRRPSEGLIRRRAEEKALFLKPEEDFNPAGLH